MPLAIDFIADVVCPWCYLGWKRLHQALALRPDVEAVVTWRPYQLDPSLPEEGVDRRAYMAAKFPDKSRLQAVHDELVRQAAECGVTLNFDAIDKSPNTNGAQRLIRWAGGAGVQDAVVEGLMAAYFTQGRDIGDPVVLADIAESAGMERLVVLKLLSEGVDREAVAHEHQMAVRGGVTGVPFTIFGGRVAVVGAESAENLARAIDKAVELAA
ncbi:DsbA family oxidoreductase [Caulobacter sp. NIBR2454]|uniref:DsbA family oxidoreductase n=1 Tax=Caulobacter sp. NIBR2454 TaxID=3015996 RepID=UPI0022B73AC1|nr:DsbA family oxidoreductase [Caulobacter sp. NIBR2454]